jgi:hypothetical protein
MMHCFENRPLLNMQFQIGASLSTLRASFTNTFNVNLTLPQSIFQANSIGVSTVTIGFYRMRARKRGGSKEAPAESRPFLVCPIYEANRDRRLAPELLSKAAQYLKARENAQAAVQPPAVRHRVKMASKDECAI